MTSLSGEKHRLTQSHWQIFHKSSPGRDLNPGCGSQLAVIGNSLDHTAIGACTLHAKSSLGAKTY